MDEVKRSLRSVCTHGFPIPVVLCCLQFNRKEEHDMGDIANVILVGLMVLLGGIPSIYILVSMPIILAEKFYGKIKYGKSLYD